MTVVLITHYMDEAVQADRVIVMNKGKIIMDNTPKKVFSHVDELKSLGLDVPQVTELVHLLKQNGFDLPDDIITVEECSEALIKYLI